MKVTKARATIAGVAVAAVASVGFAVSAQADPPASPSATPSAGSSATPGARADRDGGRLIAGGLGAFFAVTTDEQRVCLAQQGLAAPSGKLTEAERQKVIEAGRKAAETCGVRLPARVQRPGRFILGFARLSPEQQACVAKAQISRPIGRLTDAQKEKLRADVRAAAAACGIS